MQGSRQIFGISIIATVIFILWLYDTNRLGLVAGVIKGTPHLIYPATGPNTGSSGTGTVPMNNPVNPNTSNPPALKAVSPNIGNPLWEGLMQWWDNKNGNPNILSTPGFNSK
jgi:hypothetical protein